MQYGMINYSHHAIHCGHIDFDNPGDRQEEIFGGRLDKAIRNSEEVWQLSAFWMNIEVMGLPAQREGVEEEIVPRQYKECR